MRKILISNECDVFIRNSSVRVQTKFEYLINVISKHKTVSKNFVDKLVKSKFYELRIHADNQIRIILFTMDNPNFQESTEIILLNAFIKKSTKDYKSAIKTAENLLEVYKDQLQCIN